MHTKVVLKSVLAAATLFTAQNCFAFLCFQGRVAPADVAGLSSKADLFFQQPNTTEEVGRLGIQGKNVNAESMVNRTSGEPVLFTFEGSAKKFVLQSSGELSDLVIENAKMGVTKDKYDLGSVRLVPTPRKGEQRYPVKMVDNSVCDKAFAVDAK